MYRGLYVDAPESVRLQELPALSLTEIQIRIRTEFASIKHGTEFTLFSGRSPFETQQLDPTLRLFVPRDDTSPLLVGQFIGNMVVGTVTDTGSAVTRFRPGDRVYCYAPACEIVVRKESEVNLLPPLMSAETAVCLDPSVTALGAVRDGRVGPGDNVVVFGLGAIGLLIVQLLRLSGCRKIIAIDPLQKRRERAEHFGATLTLDPTKSDVAMEVREHVGTGADITIEASGSYRALREAIRTVRPCGRVVTLGYYKGRDTELELGMEWFHNRLEMVCSLPAWGNPLRDAPLWDEKRLYRTVTEWFCDASLTADGIIDPIVPFAEAADAFLSIYHNPAQAIKLGIRFL